MGYEGYRDEKPFTGGVFATAFAWLAGPGLAAIVKAVAQVRIGKRSAALRVRKGVQGNLHINPHAANR
jgi:hypothetical protein